MKPPSKNAIRYFGDYVLFGQIAEGAMGEVWFARQETLGRPVALKLIRAGTLATPTDVERFRIEAQAAARLNHENIVRVFEVGEHEGRHFLSMELIEGASLAAQLTEGAWRVDSKTAGPGQRASARLLAAVARAVHHAHQRGVLHRDIKPANILIDDDGRPHLSDFGLAKIQDANSSLTRSGAILGTLSYMSPEQARGKSDEATTATDIYSLGAVLYELLTGQPPFQGNDLAELLRQVAEDEPVPPRRVTSDRRSATSEAGVDHRGGSDPSRLLDRDLETICLKCLQKEPSSRYPTAEALADDLDRWLNGEPILARPTGPFERAWKWVCRHPVTAALSLTLAVALVVGLVTTTWQWHRAEHQRALTLAALARSQLQRADAFFDSEQPHLALPILARVLRDDPGNRVAQERLVNALNHRAILAPARPPETGSSAAAQLALRIARAPNRPFVATATNADATTIQLWDARNGALLGQNPNAHSNVIRSLTFHSDGRRLVSTSADGTAKIWETTPFRLLVVLPHPAAVNGGEFSSSGDWVLTAAGDGIARLWDPGSGDLVFKLPPRRHALNMARFAPNDAAIATGTDDGTVQLWELASNGVHRWSEPLTLSNAVWNLSFGENVILATLDDGVTHTLAWTRPIAARPVRDESRKPSHSPTPPGPPRSIDALLGRPAATFHSAAITSTNFSPDGRFIATASLDHTARIWDVQTLTPTTEPLVHSAPVNCARFSADGLRLATSTSGNRARLWDTTTGLPLTGWIDFNRPVAHVAFASNDTEIESSSGESWSIHHAVPPASLWLAEIAEALGGSRLDDSGRVGAAPPFSEIRERVRQSTGKSPLEVWAKQLFDSPPSRR